MKWLVTSLCIDAITLTLCILSPTKEELNLRLVFNHDKKKSLFKSLSFLNVYSLPIYRGFYVKHCTKNK